MLGRLRAKRLINFQKFPKVVTRQFSDAAGVPTPKKRGILRKLATYFAGLTGCTALAIATYAQIDEGFNRTLRFWSIGFPVYLHYECTDRWHKNTPQEERDVIFNKLHDYYSPIVKEHCLKLGGFYQKHAQFCSMIDDFMPPQYLEWMKVLQDKAACPITNEEAKEIVERTLGRKIEEMFSEWQDDPIGAASIGQCYKAKLLDGTVVAVKVQGPSAERTFRGDLKVSRDFCKLAMPQHVDPLNEIEKQFATEFDYMGEAQNLLDVANNLKEWEDRVVVPKPYMDLCSKDVLTMDFITGKKFVEAIQDFYKQYAERNGTTLGELEAEQKKRMSDPDFKFTTLEEESKRQQYLYWTTKAEDVWQNFGKIMWNCSLGLLLGYEEIKWGLAPVDLGATLRLIMEVHGYEIIMDGCFNGDPHPGNILLCDDGRIGLIDYGQVKRWEMKDQIIFAKMVLALEADDEDEIVRMLTKEMKYATKFMKPDILYIMGCFYFDRDDKSWPNSENIQRFTEWLEAQDPVRNHNDTYVMAGRAALMIRWLGKGFGLSLRTSDHWGKYARQLLIEQNVDYYLVQKEL